jgi:queuine tRNA-ribosyltransferase
MRHGNAHLDLPHGQVPLPAFLPDATSGVVRAVDSQDMERSGIHAIVMNTFHLMQRPGSSTVRALGGLHTMAGWSHPIVTDSGGFQAYSLVRQHAKFGRVDDDGLTFMPEGADRKYVLTPEKTIQLQVAYGTDVAICLDDCTHIDDAVGVQEASVRRTIAWALRCKREFQRLLDERGRGARFRPMLFAVIQGGASRALRRQCAESLLEIGFDGFGFGGWPLDAQGNLLSDLIAFTRALVPNEFPMHALGVGHPVSVARCAGMGYDLFDSALPTRDARSGRLYAGTAEPDAGRDDWFAMLYLHDEKHIKSRGPIAEGCDCLCCTRYSLGYLRHLHKLNDSLCARLATIHNLRFMARLMARLSKGQLHA